MNGRPQNIIGYYNIGLLELFMPESEMSDLKDNLIIKDEFAIISNNCWGAEVYKDFCIPYNTPFVGLFIPPMCFVKLCKNVTHYLKKDLEFIETSKYAVYGRTLLDQKYPLAVLEDVEIHFLHYHSEQEAASKWQRRLQKINKDNMLILYAARDYATSDSIKAFSELPYKHKLCMAAKPYPLIPLVVYFDEYKHMPEFPGADIARTNVAKKIDWIKVLNGLQAK